MADIAEKLKKALELLGPNGENWIQGTYHVWDEARAVVKYCGLGACRKSGLGGFGLELAEYIPAVSAYSTYWQWQDAPERTFSEVREVFQKAIMAASPEPPTGEKR